MSVIRSFLLICTLLFAASAQAQVSVWQSEWPNTDFTKSNVHFNEILSCGPPRDGIPALNDPQMIRVAQETRIPDREPVMTVELDGEIPRAYPIRYLIPAAQLIDLYRPAEQRKALAVMHLRVTSSDLPICSILPISEH